MAKEIPSSEEVAEIRRVVVRLSRRLRAERGADALSANKIAVLGHLRRNGPMTAGALAAADRQRPQSLTRVFAELEDEGLITRSADESDRRQIMVDITSAGREALVADMADRDAWLSSAMAALTETERGVLRLAAALMERLAASA
ncbi:MarR family winged helix-turn-helix transcriptional regulator [Nonomuraea jiangxiensis]|uniref:DNA-binding transcriptional regulator, MarR family n=1 Tax=Nonomuraea jiangxiensis TaxID=633440 RepID=A0A1G9ML32_9ACTN|nr:MarR family transcriptional regulator [Nonomuraea jiangxiensis]SDL74365.1 DNA-binding transcriptional regulator, MarR family [Nonomuraea jiangxiensis]